MNNSSWFPLKRFTHSPVHFDWTMGISNWVGIKDAITGKPIGRFTTVFWNRTKGLNVSLESYNMARKSKDPLMIETLKKLELPTDIEL